MSSLSVIVTGAGSIVGQGIVKALRMSTLRVRITATDIAPLNAALFRADDAQLMAPVEAPDALPRILDQLRRIKADAIMMGSEFDIRFFARHQQQIEAETGTRVIVSPPETIELADDKLATTRFLASHGLSHAPAIGVDNADMALAWAADRSYPLVLKTRRGTSARHVYVVKDEAELRSLLPTVPNPMLQEMAGPITNGLGGEYTCSIFRCADGSVRGPFVCRRTLRGGSSWLVEVRTEPAADHLMRELGRLVPSVGSLNVQMMIHDGRAVPFELNARFSGTTPIRAHYGFNEPEMALRSYVLGESIQEPAIGQGTVIRYVEEIFLDGTTADDIAAPFPRGTINRWF